MGKVVPQSSARTVATEAVFSKNGKIKKRLKNFETIVVDTSDNVLVFPPKQLSSDNNDLNIPAIVDGVANILEESEDSSKAPAARHGTLLVGFIVAITFSWSIYSLFFTAKDSDHFTNTAESDNEISTQIITDSNITENSISSLKQHVGLMLKNSDWNSDDINSFLNQWNSLNEKDIKQVTETSWYHLLEYNVKKRLAELKEVKSADQSSQDQALITLSLVMGIKDIGYNKDIDRGSSPTDKNQNKYKQLLAEITSELENAEKQSRKVLQTEDSESALYNKLRSKYEVNKRGETDNSNKGSSAVVKPHTNTVIFKEKSTHTSQISQNSRLNSSEINAAVLTYKKAYEQGDIKLMAQLFGATAKNSNKYKAVVANFNSTFKNTKNRSINFYDTTTSVSSDHAVVETKYNASVEFKNGKGIQYTVATVKLHLYRSNNTLVLNRVDVVDRQVNVVSRQNTNLTTSNGMLTDLGTQVAYPTAAELQDVTTQLVYSYESGNLEQFLSLLSSDIKTNDRIDLSGVRNDYSELFKTTSDRQMFIQNMKWTNESIGAKGTGDLEVIILSEEGKTVYSMEGKIQIVAQKLDNKVKITHLYHIEREK